MSVFLTVSSSTILDHVKPLLTNLNQLLLALFQISNLLGGGLQSGFLVRELIQERRPPEQMESEVLLTFDLSVFV